MRLPINSPPSARWGGAYSYALDINTAGQVAGVAEKTVTRYRHATVWNGTIATDLDPLGGWSSYGYAINDAGVVVGSAGNVDATVWKGTTATSLNTTLGEGPDHWAYGINTAGQVVGTVQVPGLSHPGFPDFRAFVWNGTTATILGPQGVGSSFASAINDAGLVVGTSDSTVGRHATLWNGTTATDLGTLGGLESRASAINNAGQVVGQSGIANSYYSHATLWNGTTATDLGTLGGMESWARDINDAGLVAGWSDTPAGDRHATLWNGTTATDLNSFLDASTVSAGWVLRNATGINANGWIVGSASNSILGIESRAFLLTPVPEAETWAMMLAGLGLVGWTTLRRRHAASNGIGA